ncbi:hypothetical protein BGX27_004883 [Mortierella sp. AM989]|nr:hypothetical protein BGX27_004883 [Mortierella sp. AM989]
MAEATTTPSTSSSFASKKTKRTVPYFASCFSPLDLPSEIFVCLLEFLSPADLWRLCQVSRAMQIKVVGFMSKIQRFKYGAVRILHQEHLNAIPDLSQREHTFYGHMTYEASLSSSRLSHLLQAKTPSQVHSRSTYWLAQASYLVAIITEGTKFEPEFGNSLGMQEVRAEIVRKSGRNFSVPPPSSEDMRMPDTLITPPTTITTTMSTFSESTSGQMPQSGTTMTTPTSTNVIGSPPLPSPISSGYQSPKPSPECDTLEPLLIDRFGAIVDLIFDPNIVHLNHRRAIINCARYVSASIDESFRKAVATQNPVNPVFYSEFQTQYSVKIGPHLTMVTPIRYNDNGNDSELSLNERKLTRDVRSTTIAPPMKLNNYIQVLLWHRCMNDLVRIYNRVHNRHIDIPLSKLRYPEGAMCCQELKSQEKPAIYPFCCKAHSLVFTAQYPISFVPYLIRAEFRRMIKIVQSVSQKSLLPSLTFGTSESATPPNRRIQCVWSSKKLDFCNGSAQNQSSSHNQSRPTDEELVRRRHQVEEQTRQDNLVKQELLSLCHMACGLFLIDDQSPEGPSTIMSLLRQGAPWNKGVWREGEWQHDSISQCASNHQNSSGDSRSRNGTSKTTERSQSGCDPRDMGRWQKLCIAAIQFLANENLAWGGNRANAELSRLRATSNANAWIYYE